MRKKRKKKKRKKEKKTGENQATRADRGADERDFARRLASGVTRFRFSLFPFLSFEKNRRRRKRKIIIITYTCVLCHSIRSSRSVLIACPRPLVPPRNRVLEPQCVFHRQPT